MCAKGGYGPTERKPRMCPLEQGGLFQPRGPNSMVTQQTRRFQDFLGKPPNRAILGPRDPQNRTRDHVSVPKGPKISSFGPFSSHFVRIPSQIRPNPTHSTWEEHGYGFWLFFHGGPWILKVPKRPWKRHFWIAELRSFKMQSAGFFAGRIAIFPQNLPKLDE